MLGKPPALWAALVVQLFEYFVYLRAKDRCCCGRLPCRLYVARSALARVSRVNKSTAQQLVATADAIASTRLDRLDQWLIAVVLAMCVGHALRSSKGFRFCQVLCVQCSSVAPDAAVWPSL